MNPRASIIIPTHQVEKREGNIINLLQKLSRVLDPDLYEVIVVCNNGNVARHLGVSEREPLSMMPGSRVKVVNLRANYGLSYAWNRGLEQATGDYIFFVNHDLILTRDENIFEQMIKRKEYYEVRAGRNVFLFGVEGTRQTDNPDVRMVQRLQIGQFGEVTEVDEVSGFLFGIKSSLLYPNFFDEKLSPCFYEEMDLCLRLRDHNKQLRFMNMEPMVNVIIPDVGYRHDFGVSAADPRNNVLLWFSSLTKETYREDLWTINRRNKRYLERKWNVTLV